MQGVNASAVRTAPAEWCIIIIIWRGKPTSASIPLDEKCSVFYNPRLPVQPLCREWNFASSKYCTGQKTHHRAALHFTKKCSFSLLSFWQMMPYKFNIARLTLVCYMALLRVKPEGQSKSEPCLTGIRMVLTHADYDPYNQPGGYTHKRVLTCAARPHRSFPLQFLLCSAGTTSAGKAREDESFILG